MNKTPTTFYAPLTYDAVWSIALALNASQDALPAGKSLSDFRYGDISMTSIFMKKMSRLAFEGMTVSVTTV